MEKVKKDIILDLDKIIQERTEKMDKSMKNGIIGFVVGDVLGVPVEFMTREELRKNPVVDLRAYGTHNQPLGSWSDDTSMTLATMDSIIHKEKIDTTDIGNRFLNWYRKNKYTPRGKVFDIGRTTIQALVKYELKLNKAKNCGEEDEYSNGNGSLMRMIPIAYYIYYKKIKDDKEIYNIVKDVSSITHKHEVSILGCYIYVSFILGLLNGLEKKQAYKNIKKLNYNYFSKDSLKRYDRILKGDITALNLNNINSDGYIVSTLECVLYMFLKSNDYNTTILEGVNLGNDTDTIGSCLGGLLGLYYGLDSIKESWKENIIKYDYIIDLCNKFENIILRKKYKNLINQKAIKRLAKYKKESHNVGLVIKVNGKYKQLEGCKK